MGFDDHFLSFLIVLYTVVFVIGLVLNISILTVILSSRLNRSRISNLYLMQFLIIDVISCIVNSSYNMTALLVHLPRREARTVAEYATACGLSTFTVYVVSVIKVLSLMLLSLERFFAVRYPLLYPKYSSRKLLLLLTAYIVFQAVSTMLPSLLKPGWIEYFGEVGGACGMNWGASVVYYVLPVVLLNFVIPAAILVVTNISVFIIARKQRKRDRELHSPARDVVSRKAGLVKTLVRTVWLMESGNGQPSETYTDKSTGVLCNATAATGVDDVILNSVKLNGLKEFSENKHHRECQHEIEAIGDLATASLSVCAPLDVGVPALELVQQGNFVISNNDQELADCRTEWTGASNLTADSRDNDQNHNVVLISGRRAGMNENGPSNDVDQIANKDREFSNGKSFGAAVATTEVWQNNNADDVTFALESSPLPTMGGRNVDFAVGNDISGCIENGNRFSEVDPKENGEAQYEAIEYGSFEGGVSEGSSPEMAVDLKEITAAHSEESAAPSITGFDQTRCASRCRGGPQDQCCDDPFRHLTRQKRLRLLSLPTSYNDLESDEARWNIVQSTLLVVLCHFVTYLPFIVSRLVETLTPKRVLSSEVSAATAAINNLDVILIPLIILWTRGNFRKELKEKLRATFRKWKRG